MVNLVLLGQYGVSGRLTGEFNDLISNSVKLELEKDGLLWASTNNDRTVPLLRSTRVLLKTLKLQVPGDDGSMDDDVAQEDSDEVAGKATVDDENDEVTQDAENDVKDEELKSEDDEENEEKTQAKQPTVVRLEDEPYQCLERGTNVVERISNALWKIRDMSREVSADGKASQQGRRGMTQNQRRLKALEHQRDRLQQQLTDVDEELTNDEADGDNNNKSTDPMDNPWIHLSRILNSIRVLTPVLLPMFMHPKRNDGALVIRGDRIRVNQRKKRPTCWLIGEHVYASCKTATCQKLYRQLISIFELLNVFEKDVSIESTVWQHALETLMKQIASHTGTAVAVVSSSPSKIVSIHPQHQFLYTHQQHPFDDESVFAIELRDELEKVALSWDEELGLQEETAIKERLLYDKAVNRLHVRISKLVKQVFPDAILSIYGSCLSDLSVGKSSDVDLSIYIERVQRNKEAFESGMLPVSDYERDMKSTVFRVCRKLEHYRGEFRDMFPVTRARVPVVNGTYNNAGNPHTEDGSLKFDICFLNDIAVANSALLREYSLVDPRAKQLMIAVKRWSKGKDISSARSNTFSSYTWTNMVVFYLQNIGLVPNLQNADLLEKTGVAFEKNDRWHSINNLDTRYVTWEQAKRRWKPSDNLSTVPVSALLYGFFRFYSSQFLSSLYAVSVKRGRDVLLPKTVFRSATFGFVIEDPFETWNSHCPHNLGGHANSRGMAKIIRCLHEAEACLRTLFLAVPGKKGFIQAPTLWPVDEEAIAPGGTAGTQNDKLDKRYNGQTGAKNEREDSANRKRDGNAKGKSKKQTNKVPRQQKKGRDKRNGARSKQTPDELSNGSKSIQPDMKPGEKQVDATNGDTHPQGSRDRSREPKRNQQTSAAKQTQAGLEQKDVTNGDQHPQQRDRPGGPKTRNRRKKAKPKHMPEGGAVSENATPEKQQGERNDTDAKSETKKDEKPAKKKGGGRGHGRRPRGPRPTKPAADSVVIVSN